MNDPIRVEVESAKVDERGGTIKNGARAGEQYHMREQRAFLYTGGKYPKEFRINLGERPAFAPGLYTIAPESFDVGDFDSPVFKREMVLTPLVDSKSKAA